MMSRRILSRLVKFLPSHNYLLLISVLALPFPSETLATDPVRETLRQEVDRLTEESEVKDKMITQAIPKVFYLYHSDDWKYGYKKAQKYWKKYSTTSGDTLDHLCSYIAEIINKPIENFNDFVRTTYLGNKKNIKSILSFYFEFQCNNLIGHYKMPPNETIAVNSSSIVESIDDSFYPVDDFYQPQMPPVPIEYLLTLSFELEAINRGIFLNKFYHTGYNFNGESIPLLKTVLEKNQSIKPVIPPAPPHNLKQPLHSKTIKVEPLLLKQLPKQNTDEASFSNLMDELRFGGKRLKPAGPMIERPPSPRTMALEEIRQKKQKLKSHSKGNNQNPLSEWGY